MADVLPEDSLVFRTFMSVALGCFIGADRSDWGDSVVDTLTATNKRVKAGVDGALHALSSKSKVFVPKANVKQKRRRRKDPPKSVVI